MLTVCVLVLIAGLLISAFSWAIGLPVFIVAVVWIAVRELKPEKKLRDDRPRAPTRIDIKHDGEE